MRLRNPFSSLAARRYHHIFIGSASAVALCLLILNACGTQNNQPAYNAGWSTGPATATVTATLAVESEWLRNPIVPAGGKGGTNVNSGATGCADCDSAHSSPGTVGSPMDPTDAAPAGNAGSSGNTQHAPAASNETTNENSESTAPSGSAGSSTGDPNKSSGSNAGGTGSDNSGPAPIGGTAPLDPADNGGQVGPGAPVCPGDNCPVDPSGGGQGSGPVDPCQQAACDPGGGDGTGGLGPGPGPCQISVCPPGPGREESIEPLLENNPALDGCLGASCQPDIIDLDPAAPMSEEQPALPPDVDVPVLIEESSLSLPHLPTNGVQIVPDLTLRAPTVEGTLLDQDAIDLNIDLIGEELVPVEESVETMP